jgi:hypothetical protein
MELKSFTKPPECSRPRPVERSTVLKKGSQLFDDQLAERQVLRCRKAIEGSEQFPIECQDYLGLHERIPARSYVARGHSRLSEMRVETPS